MGTITVIGTAAAAPLIAILDGAMAIDSGKQPIKLTLAVAQIKQTIRTAQNTLSQQLQ